MVRVSLAALLLLLFWSAASLIKLTENFTQYLFRPWPFEGEVQLFALLTLFGVPAAWLLARAVPEARLAALLSSAKAQPPRALVLLFAAFALLLAWGVRQFVTGDADFTDDERLNWYQAQVLLSGHFLGPLPPVAKVFDYEFILRTPNGEGLAGLFPLGQPALIAFGALLGNRDLSQWLCVGGTVLFTWKLAARVFEDERVGVVAGLLAAISPWLVFASGSRHSGVPTALFTTGTLYFALSFLRAPTLSFAAATGAFISLTFMCRSLDGLLLGLTVGALWCHALWKLPAAERAARVKWMAAGVLACVAVLAPQLWNNLVATGSVLKPSYALWLDQSWPAAKLFGFGKGTWNFEQTPETSALKTVTAGFRALQWISGSLWSLVPLAFALMDAELRKKASALWLYAALLILGYALFIFPSVHDFGTLYHLSLLPILACVSAAALFRLAERFTAPKVTALAVAAVVVSGATFWTFQRGRLARVADGVAQPIALAERTAEDSGVPLLVLWKSMQGPKRASWVFKAPPLPPDRSAPVIWAKDDPPSYDALAKAFPDRLMLKLVWDGPRSPRLIPLVAEAAPSAVEQEPAGVVQP